VTSGPKTRYLPERVRRSFLAGSAVAAALALSLAPGCSLAEGSGTVVGTLNIPNCWSGDFNLQPNFFAAIPSASAEIESGASESASTSDALQLRIQNGGDFENFSDGLAILIDDAGEIRGDPGPNGQPRPSLLGQNLVVSIPVGVSVPGVPIVAVPNPGIVHATLYLQKSCRTQNIALYALSAVTTNADGSCVPSPTEDEPLACGAPAVITDTDGGAPQPAYPQAGADAGGPFTTRTSWIKFQSLFDGNPDESDAQKRLTQATFEFYLANPREICPGGGGPPPRCRAHLKGDFKFYFERGQPAQPFP
jgi:hypothetical protein